MPHLTHSIYSAALPNVKAKHADFTPHLTLAQCPTAEKDAMLSQLEAWLGPNGINTIVQDVSLIARSKVWS
jgi:hypothetical protein